MKRQMWTYLLERFFSDLEGVLSWFCHCSEFFSNAQHGENKTGLAQRKCLQLHIGNGRCFDRNRVG